MIGGSFECSEDDKTININGRQLSSFPQNLAILNVLKHQVQRRDSVKSNTLRNNSARFSKNLSERATKRNPLGSTQSYKTLVKPRFTINSLKKESAEDQKDGLNNTHELNSYSDENIDTVCIKHQKKLEVICLEDGCQKRICYQCGLFGDHTVS